MVEHGRTSTRVSIIDHEELIADLHDDLKEKRLGCTKSDR